MFLQIWQNSQENTCVRASFAGLRPLLKKSLWHKCFPVKFPKILRIPFSLEHVWWLFLTLLY